mgnify:CR=1 FL=1
MKISKTSSLGLVIACLACPFGREGLGKKDKNQKQKQDCVCVCVCVWETTDRKKALSAKPLRFFFLRFTQKSRSLLCLWDFAIKDYRNFWLLHRSWLLCCDYISPSSELRWGGVSYWWWWWWWSCWCCSWWWWWWCSSFSVIPSSPLILMIAETIPLFFCMR